MMTFKEFLLDNESIEYHIENPPTREHSKIELSSGVYLDFDNPSESNITIDDIAHGLSHTCRFAGQAKTYFTVSQHSMLVESIVAEAGGSLEERMIALFHDSPEAFMGDCPTPLKDLLPFYRKMEETIASAIGEKFGVELVKLPGIVKDADTRALHIEAKSLMVNADWAPHIRFTRGIVGVSDPSGELVTLPPYICKDQYISKYWLLKLKMDKDEEDNTSSG